MNTCFQVAGGLLFAPLSGIPEGWGRLIALIISILIYFWVVVGFANLANDAMTTGWRPVAGCGIALIFLLLGMAAARVWIVPHVSVVSDTVVILCSAIIVGFAVAVPLLAFLLKLHYWQALMAWVAGLAIGWCSAYVFVLIWDAFARGKGNTNKLLDHNKQFEKILN